ncbi:MAG: inositol monophosphatase family protein [Dehalococcoidia bacterium]|nr:inositol monophosphatase family protein [Dehalococcoidia bacterium]
MDTNVPEELILKELEAASMRLAKGAGLVLQRYQPGNTHVEYKGKEGTDPVTEADLRIEEYLREEISREFPGHGMVAEEDTEAEAANVDFMWAIDPLDGTANFAAGMPLYAVSIGLLYKGVPILGSLFLPNTFAGGGVYHARMGGGAFVDEDQLKVVPNSLLQPSGLAGIPASYRAVFSSKRTRGMGEVRIMGSISCEMVLVASGVFQYSFFAGSHIWDVAAGVVLIREAGGEVLEWRRGQWLPFQDFAVKPNKLDESLSQAFRRWGAPLLAGAPEIVTHLASQTRVRRRPLLSSLRRIKTLRARTREKRSE